MINLEIGNENVLSTCRENSESAFHWEGMIFILLIRNGSRTHDTIIIGHITCDATGGNRIIFL